MELKLPFSDPEPAREEDEEDEEEEELSALDYARATGISIDYTTELPSFTELRLSLLHTLDTSSTDAFDALLAAAVPAAAALAKQKSKLAISPDVAVLLRSTLSLPEPGEDAATVARNRWQRVRGLKQELPVLGSDDELDLLRFGRRVETDLRDLRTRIPSEDVDEADEGLAWPKGYAVYPAVWDAMVKSEKLAVTREGLEFLQGVVGGGFSVEEYEGVLAGALERKGDAVARHLTPPLLPLSPPMTPYVPSSPVNHLPLASSNDCDAVTEEAKALEEQIMARDSLARLHSGSSDSMLLDVEESKLDAFLDFGVKGEASSPCPKTTPVALKRRAEDLKVEGPLTPPLFSDSPAKKLKSVSFSNMARVMEPWADEHQPGMSDSVTDELFKEIGSLAIQANREVENEKLTGADTTARVTVPFLDFTLPVAPWDMYSQRNSGKRRPGTTELESQMQFLLQVKRDDLRTASAWRGGSDLDLIWGWFASPTSSIRINEKLHGETEFIKLQAEIAAGPFATSANEVWKKEGLRVLDDSDDDDEDELELAEVEGRNDIEALVRKRKMEMELDDEDTEIQKARKDAAGQLLSRPHLQPGRKGVGDQHQQTQFGQTPISPRPQQSRLPVSKLEPAAVPKSAPNELMFGGFSASTALHKFMETQGQAVQPVKNIAQTDDAPPNISAQALSTHSKCPSAESSLFVSPDAKYTVNLQDNKIESLPRPLPKLLPPLDLPPSSIIISTSLLQRRPLMKQVEALHPKAELIYRDYTLPHLPSSEADMILSPSTGLLLTTLQQIKQLPLPGRALHSLVKQRLITLQTRYERLILLISEGLREETGYSRPEDARDTTTLTSLETFATQLEGDVEVRYVHGGEQALARGIVDCMAQYGLASEGPDMRGIKLFAVETTWEIFLRRAGLNPFAAQSIIASLKTPTPISTSTLTPLPPRSLLSAPHSSSQTTTTGLSTFLLMTPEERGARFQALLGGRRILDRVGALLDQRWLSAAHGFVM